MRWICLIAAVIGFALAFTTKSPGVLGLSLLLGFGGLIGFVLAWASARIAETAQPAATLIVDPEVTALRSKARQVKAHLATNSIAEPASTSQPLNAKPDAPAAVRFDNRVT
jgi:cytoskeletal protein RodZ